MSNKTTQESFETDHLPEVYDTHRVGAVRFKDSLEVLNSDTSMSTPPWTSIGEFEHASLKLEEDTGDDTENLKWINLLLAPGSFLGGTRPKASVSDERGALWIAKVRNISIVLKTFSLVYTDILIGV